jgi:hypothetical protein
VWLGNNGRDVKFVKSTDGGDSFTNPVVLAKGIVPLASPYLEDIDGWNHLPGASFRMGTYCNGCAGSGNNVIFAWADYREEVSRIYYRRSADAGNTWEGPSSGQPLLTGGGNDTMASEADHHDFHPQLTSTPSGELAVLFINSVQRGVESSQ